jgi:hypothetical protein
MTLYKESYSLIELISNEKDYQSIKKDSSLDGLLEKINKDLYEFFCF